MKKKSNGVEVSKCKNYGKNSFRSRSKVYRSLLLFSRNSHLPNGFTWTSPVSDFNQMGQETLILLGEIYLRPEVTYDYHYDDFHVTHTCSTAMCPELLCRISWKFDSIFTCWYKVTDSKAELCGLHIRHCFLFRQHVLEMSLLVFYT